MLKIGMLFSKLIYYLSFFISNFILLSAEKVNINNFRGIELFFLCFKVLLDQIEFERRWVGEYINEQLKHDHLI